MFLSVEEEEEKKKRGRRIKEKLDVEIRLLKKTLQFLLDFRSNCMI